MKPSRSKLGYAIHSIFGGSAMFLTHLQARVMDADLFSDVITWRYVEHSIHRPWLYVAAVEKNQDFDLRPMLMIGDVNLLQSLLSDQGSGLQVESILLVTPDHMNRSGRWMMEPLVSIDKVVAPDAVAYVYSVESGRAYIEGDPEVSTRTDAQRVGIFTPDMLSQCVPNSV
ncbi:hypothetical protein PS676_02014 [Pseudomonas fluorescens]|nr:hypothetical protein PS676_02014 [Pseudomonas fluorescens]